MPLYDFECEECKQIEEHIQSYKDPPPEHCNRPMRRLVGGPILFDFKGSGFYITDYKKAKNEGK